MSKVSGCLTDCSRCGEQFSYSDHSACPNCGKTLPIEDHWDDDYEDDIESINATDEELDSADDGPDWASNIFDGRNERFDMDDMDEQAEALNRYSLGEL